ncbi:MULTISPECIES: glucose 1-dehydrogenase [Methanoculleus]|uniref:Glucose 1-dehydrogenase n=2 Tax=Methanoculleus TaxID=45989 RepID=A3CX59_METMJ|nr:MULTISPECIES: glucose 1-dehydrogenase [Methanoculleus]ABN57959.1 glucose 1-dehydrogenase [Methanoculleus marisnigri JR1]MCC7556208.1 glucose 1-dehydrogenase [Methanoculleus marisnigri]UYU19342.1 glucose 1-dehydrogenase [Methanoculleus submarinus]
MKRLEGKNVLVTGGSTGIGRATAIRFADEGANVAINYHSSETEAEITLEETKNACSIIREKGCREMLVQGDIASEEDVRRIFREVLTAWGRLDILVNNAGIQTASPTHETAMDAYDRVLAVNLRGASLCSREAVRHFLERGGGGVILNNTSVHETIPKPQYAPYAASKAGLGALSRTLALEYAGQGIRVNTVAPGAINSPINREWTDDPGKKADVEGHIPMGRAGEPEEIAAAFAFLASDEAAYITGQTIYVDGGLTLYPDFRMPWSSGS